MNPPSIFRALSEGIEQAHPGLVVPRSQRGFNSGDRDLAWSGETRSVQVSPTKLFDQKLTGPPGKRDIRKGWVLFRIGRKYRGVSDEEIRNFVTLTMSIHHRIFEFVPMRDSSDPVVLVNLQFASA